jgi:hypothetical protein
MRCRRHVPAGLQRHRGCRPARFRTISPRHENDPGHGGRHALAAHAPDGIRRLDRPLPTDITDLGASASHINIDIEVISSNLACDNWPTELLLTNHIDMQ